MLLFPETLIMPGHTLTGPGSVKRLFQYSAVYGARGLIVHGRSLKKNGMLDALLAHKPPSTSIVLWEHPGGEPILSYLVELLKAARKHRAKWIAGIGGGSVMDLAKSCAGLYHATLDPSAYHDGAYLESTGIAFAAVPTTAGTGSEATINAVLTNLETGQKKSIRDDRLAARLIILDENLLASCPKNIIALSGMDALTQAIESYVSRKTTWLSETLALKALSLISGNLEKVYDKDNGEARAHLLIGSYLSGLSLSIARLGLVHGLAHPLGARYHLPHGLACAVLLPHVIEMNRKDMKEKYDRMSEVIGVDLLMRVQQLLVQFRLDSPLKGRPLKDKDKIITETLASGSTKANPKLISERDIEFLLQRIFNESP